MADRKPKKTGWFRRLRKRDLVRVSGPCVIEVEKGRPHVRVLAADDTTIAHEPHEPSESKLTDEPRRD